MLQQLNSRGIGVSDIEASSSIAECWLNAAGQHAAPVVLSQQAATLSNNAAACTAIQPQRPGELLVAARSTIRIGSMQPPPGELRARPVAPAFGVLVQDGCAADKTAANGAAAGCRAKLTPCATC